MSKITAIHGASVSTGEVNEVAVRVLEDALERAKSGEVVGVGIMLRHSNGLASYALGGAIGGYSILGALEMVRSELVAINHGDD